MPTRRSALSWGLRASAAVVSGAAVGILLHRSSGEPATAAAAIVDPPPGHERPVTPPTGAVAIARARRWTLQLDGWHIAVPPEASSPPAAPPATVPAEPVREAAVQETVLHGPWQPARRPLISPYDDLIARHAAAEGFDWRLIAAVIGEESNFDPTSRSEMGAYGLMQIMPVAAREVGMEDFSEPEDNVRTGVLYLRYLTRVIRGATPADHLKLVLAAYNMGPGHLQDAQMLAVDLGHDPLVWDNEMEAVIPLLEDPEYHAFLPNGFARGRSVVRYVNRVLERFEQYRVLTARAEADSRAAARKAASRSVRRRG